MARLRVQGEGSKKVALRKRDLFWNLRRTGESAQRNRDHSTTFIGLVGTRGITGKNCQVRGEQRREDRGPVQVWGKCHPEASATPVPHHRG